MKYNEMEKNGIYQTWKWKKVNLPKEKKKSEINENMKQKNFPQTFCTNSHILSYPYLDEKNINLCIMVRVFGRPAFNLRASHAKDSKNGT